MKGVQNRDEKFESITDQALLAAIAGPALLSAIHGVKDRVLDLDQYDLLCLALSLVVIQGARDAYVDRVKALIAEGETNFGDRLSRAILHANQIQDFGLIAAGGGYVMGAGAEAVCREFISSPTVVNLINWVHPL